MAAENVGAVKIVGYLEKKGKLKVVTTWKKYWFVLEGRLLLYYRSQEEYNNNLSPCKGSINMGLATNIMPGLATAGVFQIITRTNTITLRAKDRAIQEKWLQALLDASGQQTASNPIKMSHFRYSMDDLIPTGAKQQQRPCFTRQNTLPNRFQLAKVERNPSIIERIRHIGGQSYGGSLDTINRLSKGKQLPNNSQERLKSMSKKSMTETDLYIEIDMENAQSKDLDHNKNCCVVENDHYMKSENLIENDQYICSDDLLETNKIIENDQYIKSDELPMKNISATASFDNSNSPPDDIEYYCTYEEISAIRSSISQNIYHEPTFITKPEDRKSESDESETKKSSKLSRLAKRFKSLTSDDTNGIKKRFMKAIGKKKLTTEPIYDVVDYDIDKSEVVKQLPTSDNLVKTLLDLQQTLEAKKSLLKEKLESTSTCQKTNEPEIILPEEKEETESEEMNQAEPVETINPPGLPPRWGSKCGPRSRSPYHDVPKNNSPIKPTLTDQNITSTHPTDYSIDKILNDLEIESKKTDTDNQELSVRKLIQKFNRNLIGNEEIHSQIDDDVAVVSLRNKCEDAATLNEDFDGFDFNFGNRHSDDLNKLLEELTKVTCAPLLTPGVTSSLVQMKSPPLTDEEWLAIAPIRHRRHSDPDYDVPRPHRSLQILPQSDDNEDNTVIPATRFFGPVLPRDKTFTDPSMSWRSMTPDSLEPLQLLQAAMKKQQRVEMNVERDRSVGYENGSNVEMDFVNDENKSEHCEIIQNNYLDSLEPFNEGATAF